MSLRKYTDEVDRRDLISVDHRIFPTVSTHLELNDTQARISPIFSGASIFVEAPGFMAHTLRALRIERMYGVPHLNTHANKREGVIFLIHVKGTEFKR